MAPVAAVAETVSVAAVAETVSHNTTNVKLEYVLRALTLHPHQQRPHRTLAAMKERGRGALDERVTARKTVNSIGLIFARDNCQAGS